MFKLDTTLGKSWTGQTIVNVVNGKEYVECPVCKDKDFPVSLQSSGWFDKTIETEEQKGAYVHYGCLSEARKKELKQNA